MKLLVLDGNSILNRAYYGIKLLSTQDGFYTNAIYGFLNILLKLKSESEPDAVAVAFDLKKPTFRHKMFDGYKANRKGMPTELAMQLPKLKELLSSLGYKIVECEGFEADDILGTLAEACNKNSDNCIIATGDRDLLQLVSDNVTVRITATKFGKPQVTIYDKEKVKEKYGLTPGQLIDLKALQGDTSDNIPGVRGVGEKTASELIKNFGSLDGVYENIESDKIKKGVKDKLTEDKEKAYLSLKLGTICTDAPIDKNIKNYIVSECDNNKAFQILNSLEMYSMIDKFIDRSKVTEKEDEKIEIQEPKVHNSVNWEDYESNKDNFFITYSEKEGKITCLIINICNKIYVINSPETINEALNFLSDKQKNIIVHNAKELLCLLERNKMPSLKVVFDTALAGYLINPDEKGYDLEDLYLRYKINIGNLKNTYDDCIVSNLLLPVLCKKLLFILKERDQVDLLENMEIPFTYVLAQMQTVGFQVSSDSIKEYGEKLEKEITNIEKEIYSLIGYEFNLNSPKQLSYALFEKLGLKPIKKTKSGYSTNAQVLEELKYAHPSVELILKYRTLTKIKSTYCDALLKVIHDDGRIYTTFNQTETRTGRISSLDPNLQNIPVRTEAGREIRRFFQAKSGCVLVAADYSQIELRVLAHVANDKNMIEAFNCGKDIHTITASQVFNIPQDMVTPQMRTNAKAVNFGIVYGIGAFSLSKDISVSFKRAKEYIENYLAHYKGIDKYMKETVEQAKTNGYVKTIFNRRRYIPELTSSNHALRAFGERVAMNMPIQGTAADIIKIATIKVAQRISKEQLESRVIMQVHDELIVESPEEEADRISAILKEEMENCVHLKVALSVNISKGKTWYDTKE